jgi:ABC-type glycerol-3-phosphate transport system substrate-binding protein
MREVVDAFNRSQDRIVVDFLSVGQIEEKTLLATAGGDPPDISGVYLPDICAFADRNALTPLSPFIRAGGQTPDQFSSRYAKAYASMGQYNGEIWGVPSTPSTAALYWNKDLFRAAGLDPEKPPRTADEVVSMSERLTVHDAQGNLRSVGFLPQQTNSWIWAFPLWFGGSLFDGRNVTVGNDPANVKAYTWLGDFSTRYGPDNIRRLSSSFGTLSTPQDPFMNGQVAMTFDGVWRYDFIRQFAPGLNYGVAAWPQAVPGIDDFTIAESDMLVIPRGAKHPREAWEFLNYVSSPNLAAQSRDELTGVELLCYLQKKGSPLSQWSPFFTNHHPNPYIAIFRRQAESPHAVSSPKIGIWIEYARNLGYAFDKVRLGLATPQQALAYCQQRIAQSWSWNQKSLALRQQTPPPPLTTNSLAPTTP